MTMRQIIQSWLAGISVCFLIAMSGSALAGEEPKVDTPKQDQAQTQAEPQAAADGQPMVELKLKMPRPLFIGTPKDIQSANLEKPATEKPKPFMVPEGTKNVALESEITASDEEPIIGEIEMVTDGDKEGADGSYVEFGPGLQWVQIDLKEAYKLYAIVVWHFHAQARVYHDVIVRVSDDPDFLTGVTTVFNNDHDNSAGLGVGKDKEWIETYEGRIIDAKGVKARYVRLYSNGNTTNDQNHMIEVEVYGKPVQ